MSIDPGAVVDQRIGTAAGVGLHVRGRALDATGVPVLLVHGLASNARLWDGVAENLAALGHPTAAVDLRGHGASDKPDEGYDFATLAADLVAVLDGLGWLPGAQRRCFVAGQSWGATVVLELAARHPDAIRGLALVDGGTIELADRFADWPTCEAALAPPALDHLRADDFERMLRNNHPDWPDSGIEATLSNVEVRADGTIAPWLSRSHHLTILRHMWEHHPSARYHDVTVPVLILPAGSEATTDKGGEINRAEAGLAVSVTRWMAGDHDLHAQHPGEVASLLHAAAVGSIFLDK